jgi:hypothetical protein
MTPGWIVALDAGAHVGAADALAAASAQTAIATASTDNERVLGISAVPPPVDGTSPTSRERTGGKELASWRCAAQ